MADEIPAAALKLQEDGSEIAALLMENLIAAADREGRPLEPTDYTAAWSPLLAAAWLIAKAACADESAARVAFAGYLRSVADGIDPPGED